MPRYLAIGILIGALLLAVTVPVPHGLSVLFLDVGEGDSILIQGPTGITLLVDGGPDASVLRGLGAALPFFERSLDAVIATHDTSADTAGLVDVLARYQVKNFIDSGVPGPSATYKVLADALVESRTKHIAATSGMRLMLGRGAYAEIISADPASLIIRVAYGTTSFLLMGDAPLKLQKGLSMESDVLLAPHHGAPTSTTPEFVAAVKPAYVVVSAGKDNQYGYPSANTLKIFTDAGAEVLSTAERGTITFRSDGKVITSSTGSSRRIPNGDR